MKRLVFIICFLSANSVFAQQTFNLEPGPNSNQVYGPVDQTDIPSEIELDGVHLRRRSPTSAERTMALNLLDWSFADGQFRNEWPLDLFVWEKIDGTPFAIGVGIQRARIGFYPYTRKVTRAEIRLLYKFGGEDQN